MRMIKALELCICAVLLGAIFAPRARADEWNKKTMVTFNAPVEIPGKALPAGSYVFVLADSNADRHIVQIWNPDQNQLIATVMTIPEYRLDTASKTVMHFDERPINSPMALDDWFYPADLSGQQFVYPDWN